MIWALLAYCIGREIVFQVTLHKLVNKVMSRSFYDYKVSENVGKKPLTKEVKVPVEEPIDVGNIAGIV